MNENAKLFPWKKSKAIQMAEDANVFKLDSIWEDAAEPQNVMLKR